MGSSVFAVRPRAEGIAVQDVRPGLIATEMTAPVIESFRARAADGLTMAPRVGEPEEVVRLIATPAVNGCLGRRGRRWMAGCWSRGSEVSPP